MPPIEDFEGMPRLLDTIDSAPKEYLWATFIYVVREYETGIPVPPEIAAKRAEAWALVEATGGL